MLCEWIVFVVVVLGVFECCVKLDSGGCVYVIDDLIDLIFFWIYVCFDIVSC